MASTVMVGMQTTLHCIACPWKFIPGVLCLLPQSEIEAREWFEDQILGGYLEGIAAFLHHVPYSCYMMLL